MNNEDFRRYGYAVIDCLADYYDQLETRPVQSRSEPRDLRRELPVSAPARATLATRG